LLPVNSGQPASLLLNGATASAESAAAPDLNLVGDWTVELWLKDADVNGFDHTYRYLLNKGDGVAAESAFYLLLGNGSLLAGLRSGGVNHPLTYNLHSVGYSPKLWLHVAATYISATTLLTLYLDGDQVAQQALGARSPGNALPLEIGRQGPALGRCWWAALTTCGSGTLPEI
jgi:hypothetical protein